VLRKKGSTGAIDVEESNVFSSRDNRVLEKRLPILRKKTIKLE
jgi:hypothetical protein